MDIAPDYIIEYDDSYGGHAPAIRRLLAEGGMELRDFFAGHALSGLLSSGQTHDLASKAYAIADRMIEEAGRTE